jgi:hypothetical protein
MVVPEQQQIATAPPEPPASVAADSTQSQAKAPATVQAPAAPAQTFADAGRKQDADEKLRAAAEPSREDRQLKDATALKEEKTIDQAVAIAPPPTATVAIGAVAAPGSRAEAISGGVPVELQKSARLAVGSTDVFTLDPNVRWRIIGNRIGRSTDAGSTWMVVREEPSGAIFAGSAPSATVAWFAGRAGLVLVTTDAGVTFRNVNLAVSLDIASVSATDAQSAVVSTVSGQRFRTQDGGRSWTPF